MAAYHMRNSPPLAKLREVPMLWLARDHRDCPQVLQATQSAKSPGQPSRCKAGQLAKGNFLPEPRRLRSTVLSIHMCMLLYLHMHTQISLFIVRPLTLARRRCRRRRRRRCRRRRRRRRCGRRRRRRRRVVVVVIVRRHVHFFRRSSSTLQRKLVVLCRVDASP